MQYNMKRRRAPSYDALAFIGVAAITNISLVDATLKYEDYNLRVRRGHDNDLHYLFDNGNKLLAPIVQANPHHFRTLHHRSTLGVCTSPLVTWTTEKVRDMGYNVYQTLYENKILQMSFIYKHYIDKKEGSEFFVSDQQTNELQSRHRDNIAFWESADIDSLIVNDIVLLSMHGSSLKDKNNLIPTIMHIFDFDDMSEVLAFANEVQYLIQQLPGGYENPLLTMNAIATSSDDAPSSHVKDSIIIGDGVLQFLYDSGLETSGPDFVHAHEFGHHVQFQIDMTIPPGSSYINDDRRKELMADAISGYFLAHDEGGNMRPEEIGTFHETAFSTGDCSVEDNDDHHGTPPQRQCAAIWGASLAASLDDDDDDDGSGNSAPILDPQLFVDKFNDAYEDILNLDTNTCALTLEKDEATSSLVEDPPPVQEAGVAGEQQLDVVYREEGDSMTQSPTIIPPNINVSWESREKLDSKSALPYQYSSKGETQEESTNPFGYFRDRGSSPEETKQVYMNEYEEHECDLPWVYCYYTSDGARSASISGLTVTTFLAITVALFIVKN
jgi:hypothetical protein